MKFARICFVVLLLLTFANAQTPAEPDPWASVKFLIGTWEGTAEGQAGVGKSTREYKFVLNGAYIEVRNKSVYPAQPKNPKGEEHEDWGMISYDRSRKKLVLRQFHVEKFVNQFVAEPLLTGAAIRFTSESIENIPPGFRARETYTVRDADNFTEIFELAEPGKEFEVYSTTIFARRK